MTTTPIADLLGIDTSGRQIATGFEFRGQKFYWCAPTPSQPEALLRGRHEHVAQDDEWVAEALALFLTPDTGDENESADAILSEARAAIAAQGGAQ